mgnify:CR=1 FL=1
MAKVKVVLNRSGVRSLMKSEEMMQICKDHAYRAKSKLGDGYSVSCKVGKNRVNASIGAVTPKARRENSKHNTILKAVGGS